MYMMRNKKEVVMRKYNNLGVDLGGLSMTDPVRYRKINAVLNDKGKKKDLLDRVETVPLEYVYDLANDSPFRACRYGGWPSGIQSRGF